MTLAFEQIGRLAHPDDNVAIATQTLPSGSTIQFDDQAFSLSHTVLMGHRFAVRPIPTGEALRSWGQRFGIAIRAIASGDYVCNHEVLTELQRRKLAFALPEQPNFVSQLEPYHFDPATFTPAQPLPRHEADVRFLGFRRGMGRGVGTRNTIILLGTSSLVGSFVTQLEARLQALVMDYPQIDGIVAVAHTEGSHDRPNNADFVLRTLAGFMVNPNVGAVLAVDYGDEPINNRHLQQYLAEHNYPLADLPHHFMSLSPSFEADIHTATEQVRAWLPSVNATQRTPEPLSGLKIALQCGGSDAFSGISGNPLAAWVAKEVIQHGGSANLAETDELIGAENYVLEKVRDVETVTKFLTLVERFKERVGWHGHSAEGNPSGGNKYRGLYNIYLKSLGAATKRHPDVPLDAVIEYSEPMREAGYYFMDSPGNDLESIAGQVASGCNMIFFVTGNGSITNFPFVPTLKIITTTERYQLLSNEMDVNAGAYLDGVAMEDIGAHTFEHTLKIASGERSVGERAGHSQVQIWRDWQQTQPTDLAPIRPIRYAGQPLAVAPLDCPYALQIPVYVRDDHATTDQVALILPTSLCSGQIARMCVDQLNRHSTGRDIGISRFVTLVHTEGCGGSVNVEFKDTLVGYLGHPFVAHALLLEHGCESTHNAYFRETLQQHGFDPEDYGWASIQLDGGIQRVTEKIARWFEHQFQQRPAPTRTTAGLSAVKLAVVLRDEPSADALTALANAVRMIVTAGGTVVIGEHTPSLLKALGISLQQPTLSYAQRIERAGLHVMAMPTRDWGEILTGLGASGVEVMLALTNQHTLPGHPMIPVLQASEQPLAEVDVVFSGDGEQMQANLLERVVATLAHEYTPRVVQHGNVYFQVTRGLLGVSL